MTPTPTAPRSSERNPLDDRSRAFQQALLNKDLSGPERQRLVKEFNAYSAAKAMREDPAFLDRMMHSRPQEVRDSIGLSRPPIADSMWNKYSHEAEAGLAIAAIKEGVSIGAIEQTRNEFIKATGGYPLAEQEVATFRAHMIERGILTETEATALEAWARNRNDCAMSASVIDTMEGAPVAPFDYWEHDPEAYIQPTPRTPDSRVERPAAEDTGYYIIRRQVTLDGMPRADVTAIKLLGDGKDGRQRKAVRLVHLRPPYADHVHVVEVLSEGVVLQRHEFSRWDRAHAVYAALVNAGA